MPGEPGSYSTASTSRLTSTVTARLLDTCDLMRLAHSPPASRNRPCLVGMGGSLRPNRTWRRRQGQEPPVYIRACLYRYFTHSTHHPLRGACVRGLSERASLNNLHPTSGEGGGSHQLSHTRPCSRTDRHPHRNGRGLALEKGCGRVGKDDKRPISLSDKIPDPYRRVGTAAVAQMAVPVGGTSCRT